MHCVSALNVGGTGIDIVALVRFVACLSIIGSVGSVVLSVLVGDHGIDVVIVGHVIVFMIFLLVCLGSIISINVKVEVVFFFSHWNEGRRDGFSSLVNTVWFVKVQLWYKR